MPASKQYFNPEVAVSFKSTGGTVVFTAEATANGALAHSAQFDRGTGALPGYYRWFARIKASAVMTVSSVVKIYLAQSLDATNVPGRIPVTDGEIDPGGNQTRNLGALIGIIVADTTDDTLPLNASGTCFIFSQFVSVCYLNELGQALSATAADFDFILQAIPPEQQA